MHGAEVEPRDRDLIAGLCGESLGHLADHLRGEHASEKGARESAGQSHDRRLGEDERQDHPPPRPDGAKNADLPPPLGDGNARGVGDEDETDDQRQQTEHGGHGLKRAHHVLELRGASRGAIRAVPRPERALELPRDRLEIRARDRDDVHAIELSLLAEGLAGAVDVHDRDVPAERRRRPLRLEESTNRQLDSAAGGREIELGAALQQVSFGEFAREHDAVRLIEKDERVLDHFLADRFVGADFLLAQDVDTENRQRFASMLRIGEKPARFDERHGARHACDLFDRLELLFGKSGLARADGQRGLPGRRLDRLVEGGESRVVDDADGHEERHAESDPDGGENCPQRPRAKLRETDHADDSHAPSPSIRRPRSPTVFTSFSSS